MYPLKSTTIFSKLPFIDSADTEKNEESKKLSSWLEKLHIQGEKMRKDDNRREEQAKTDKNDQLLQSQRSRKEESDQALSVIDEQTRNRAAKSQADSQMVDDLVRKSNRRIISISSVFPWNLFPNTIEVEESRVTFKSMQMFASQSHSVDIKDISNVFIESSMFFATIQVVSRTYIQNDIKIEHLNKGKAVQVQRIIEGLRTIKENNINTSRYEIEELIAKIGEFHTNHTS